MNNSPSPSPPDTAAVLHTEPVNLAGLDLFAVSNADALAEMFTKMTDQMILPQFVSSADPAAA